MKKKIGLCAIVILALVIAACNLQPASSIRIKASPDFEASLGSRTDDLGKLLKEKLDKHFEGTDTKVYYYQPEGLTDSTYLIHYPLKEIDLDVNALLGNNIAPSFEQGFPSKEFTIPKIEETQTQTISLADLNTKFIEQFKVNITHTVPDTVVTAAKAALQVPSSAPVTQQIPAFGINFSGCNSLTFGAGSTLKLSITPSNITGTVTTAVLSSNGVSIPGSVQSGGSIHFDVSNKTITNPAQLTCTVSISNITDGASLGIKAELVAGSRIAKATGVTMDIDIDSSAGLQAQTIQVPDNDYFINGKIKTGSITINAPAPAGWTGITLKKSFKIVQADGISINTGTGTYTDFSEPISLNGQVISKQPITITPAVKVSLANATYVHTDNLSLGVTFKIEEFESVTLKQPDEIATPQAITHSADNIKDLVEKITFKNGEPKITVTLDHNLPGEIGLTLTSAAFNINHQQTFPQGKHTKDFASSSTPLDLNLPDGFTGFDVTPKIELPGSNNSVSPKTFTLQNVRPGSTLKFSGKVAVTADWEKVTLKNFNKDINIGDAIDLEPLTKYLKQDGKYELNMLECPMHFYFNAKALEGKNISPKIKISADVTPSNGGSTTTRNIFADSSSSAAAITIKSGQLNLDKDIITAIPEPSFSIKKDAPNVQTSFTQLLNEKPKNIKLNCHLSMTGVEVDKAAIDQLQGNSKLQIAVLIEVPVGVNLLANVQNTPFQTLLSGILDADAKANLDQQLDKDILNRKPGQQDSNEFIAFISSAAIDMSLHNPLDKAVTLSFDLQDSSNTSVLSAPKQLTLKPGSSSQSLTFTKEEMQKITATNPCKPKLNISMVSGDYKLAKNAQVTVSMYVKSKLDVDYKIK